MQRHMDAELQFNKKPVQARIDARVWRGCDGPYAAAVRFSKSDFGRRRGEVMVVDSEAHGLAKIHAAEERKSVHAISRDVKSQAGVIGKAWIAREPARVAIACDDVVQRHARLVRRNIVLG